MFRVPFIRSVVLLILLWWSNRMEAFKSSPWYVRFGKFQGVLKSKEKLVTISVNDVDADFHMYLDNRGEAHFLMEVDVEEGVSFCSPPTSSGEETDGQPENEWRLKSKSCNYDAGFSDANGPGKKSVEGNSALPYPRLGLIFGRKRTMEVERIQGEEKSCDVSRANSLERAEIAANLLDLKWSTNLASSPSNKDNASRLSSVENKVEASDGLDSGCCNHSESDVISVKETVFEANCLSSQVDSGVCIDNAKDRTKSDSPESSCDKLNVVQTESHVYSVGKVLGVRQPHFQTEGSDDKLSKTCFSDENGAVDHTQYGFEDLDTPQLGLDGTVEQQNKSYAEYEDVCGKTSNLQSMSNTLSSENYETVENLIDTQELQVHCEVLLEQGGQAIFHCEEGISTSEGYADGCSDTLITENFSQKLAPINPSNIFCKDNASENIVTCPSFKEVFSGDELADDIGYSCVSDLELKHCEGKETDATLCSVSSSGQSSIDERIHDVNHDGRRLRHVWSDGYINKIDQVDSKDILGTSLPTSGFVRNNLKASDLDIGVRYNHHITPGSQTGLTEGIMEHKEVPVNSSTGVSENSPNDSSPSRGSTKRSFSLSFKRSRSKNTSFGNDNCIESTNGVGSLESRKDRGKADTRKRLVRTLTPTSEQLASLKLQQGKNLVAFTFSTAMLGKQQVDARIFLWRWDTQIVISDVDGTITRSDLLGQVMPLVGMDWSQSGVAHLFSAIKENGYQLLFLSARSIAQSFHTRQFLLNIKQDGKALPEGPVVISPDGLFPSLFREVIRRAPHEFKIACLEEIKALFPADRNPFYAGFGNRDTDEFSYLKVGIPKGKIFIINPKGEIVVNRRIDTKSYLSLHSLVHGMFPTNASCEQEDFNTWNYWKLPPPLIE